MGDVLEHAAGRFGADLDELVVACRARIEQADAWARIAAAALAPTLSAGSGASQSLTAGAARSASAPYHGLRTPQLGLTLSASYQLDLWGRLRDSAEAARLDGEAARFDRAAVALTTEGAVASLYLQLLAAQDRLAVARRNVALAEDVLKAVRARKAAGTSSALDEAQQDSVTAQARAAIPPLEQTVAQSRNTLAVLLGETPETARIAGGSLLRLRAPVLRASLPAELLRRRPDVAEAEAKFYAQGFAVDAARKAFLPNVALAGQGGFASQTLAHLLSPQAAAYTLAASLAEPVFDGGALQGEVDAQRGRYHELLELYRKQILTALSDVENALVALRKTRETLRLDQEATVAAGKAYQAADLLLRGGTIDMITLSTTEKTYFSALDVEVQARAAWFQAGVALFLALGGGVESGRVAAAEK